MARLRRSWVASGLVMLALVSGCTSSGGAHPDGGTPTKAVEYGSQDINSRPVNQLKQGGTLTLANPQWVTQYNFNQTDGAVDQVEQIDSLVEPVLFRLDAKGVPQADPDYVTSAELTSTSPQTVTYHLNPKARWSDGKPLSVRDFAAQWQALGRGDDRFGIADPSGYDRIKDVRQGADAHEVKVVFSTPYADWQRLFTPLFPAPATGTPDQFNKGWINRIPVTAGPFRIDSIDRTAQTVTAVPDPGWWGTPPRLDKVIFRTLLPDAAQQAYLNGEIDAVNAATTEDYAKLKGAKDSEIRTGSAWDEVHVSLNGVGGPLADIDVRHAVQRAVRREALAQVAAEGLPVGVPLLGNHIFMTNQPGYADHSSPWGTYDLDEARRILDSAGWKSQGDGKPRVKDGKELRLRFVLSNATNRLGLDLAQLIQQMLAQAGVAVDITKVPANDYASKYLFKGNFDMVIFRFTGLTYPGSTVSIYQQPKGEQAFLNYGRVSDAKLDGLLKKAAGTLDRTRATELYNQADAEIWRLGHDVELYQRPQVMAVRKGLANYGVPGLGNIDFAKVGWER
ncbi:MULTISPECIES: ABC transporter family substrate-binding protein [unclassified Streptomyces]|uniref:ABC transporter family substrate-binding protein n=1 Tax=unclassified Streptomyces TaxID=2593676 RepID=UPI002E802E6F|nr:ABC transporter family substrate-binding protein [Streptomyces sp. NBC_00589]WTI36308.1 ABC transporter family substrate-binding protein [Streptomyces sp. NBC_00775]WUB30017.1 ABC transporter family substrate-binding protein [Streptomyces sp. NBC_00589]